MRTAALPPFADAARPYEWTFEAPSKPGQYLVIWGQVPSFFAQPLVPNAELKRAFRAGGEQRRLLLNNLVGYEGSIKVMGRITVSDKPVALPDVIPLYLRVNNEIPAYATFAGGLQDKPITLSWYVGNEFRRDAAKVLFRYRMEPEEDGWGAWTTATSVSFSFLHRGVHRFLVQAKYTEQSLSMESIPATFQFTLAREHVSRPTAQALTKGVVGAGAPAAPPVAFSELYAKSRALLVGLWTFEDAARFPQFDERKISADVSGLKAALERNGFEVTTLVRDRVRREDITAACPGLSPRPAATTASWCTSRPTASRTRCCRDSNAAIAVRRSRPS